MCIIFVIILVGVQITLHGTVIHLYIFFVIFFEGVEESVTAGKMAEEEKFEVRGSSSSTSTSSPTASRINTQSLVSY